MDTMSYSETQWTHCAHMDTLSYFSGSTGHRSEWTFPSSSPPQYEQSVSGYPQMWTSSTGFASPVKCVDQPQRFIFSQVPQFKEFVPGLPQFDTGSSGLASPTQCTDKAQFITSRSGLASPLKPAAPHKQCTQKPPLFNFSQTFAECLLDTGLCVKRTSISLELEEIIPWGKPQRASSAPPAHHRNADYVLPTQPARQCQAEGQCCSQALQEPTCDLFLHNASNASLDHYEQHQESKPDFPWLSSEVESEDDQFSVASEASDEFSPPVVMKVGCSMPGKGLSARLSDILKMQSEGRPTLGSYHQARQCAPCSFHFSHVHAPDTRLPCKAGYMCDYCHDANHFPKWRSSLRKRRKSTWHQESLCA
jgi:hypothetical protein